MACSEDHKLCRGRLMHCYREVSLGTRYGETMVINKIKKNNCWLKNSLQFDGWHDRDVISLHPSKYCGFSQICPQRYQNTYKNYLSLHNLPFKSSSHSHN